MYCSIITYIKKEQASLTFDIYCELYITAEFITKQND